MGSCSGMQQGILLGRGGFLEYGHFYKRFVYGIQKESSAGGNLVFFLQDTLETVF